MTGLRLEVHLTHACNFTCESCSHYSQFDHAGALSLETAESWYCLWSSRLQVKDFVLLGGEPTLHRQLCEHILLARKSWPEARIHLITNGSFLHRHPALPEILRSIGNSVLEFSRHYDSEEYRRRIHEGAYSLLLQWRQEYGIAVRIFDSLATWTRRYIEEGGRIRPFHDGDPKRSWENCRCRSCMQLHQGKLWKCPILAYLPRMKGRLSPEWDPYLQYQPLEADCSDDELGEFLSREEEWTCQACPSSPQKFRKRDPLKPEPMTP